MIKAVLFDLDGVLVDACEWHYVALNRAIMEVGGFEINREEHNTTFNGLPTKQKLLLLQLEGRITSEQCEPIWSRKQHYTYQTINEAKVNDPTKLELIKALAAKNIYTACVTNSIRSSAVAMLKKIEIFDALEFVITNEDVDNPKPSPEGYNKAMTKLGVSPEEVIIVEDSDKGVGAALATNCPHIYRVENATHVSINLFRDLL